MEMKDKALAAIVSEVLGAVLIAMVEVTVLAVVARPLWALVRWVWTI